MDMAVTVIKQHLIDPEICIRCNTCETMCPVGAITHDARNYVVDAAKCNWCNDCISPCPTGSIDNYRQVPAAKAYSLDEQLGWDELPAELSREQLADWAGAEAAALISARGTSVCARRSIMRGMAVAVIVGVMVLCVVRYRRRPGVAGELGAAAAPAPDGEPHSPARRW